MNGYLPEDYDVVHLSDQRLSEQAKSDIVPITLNKETLKMLRHYTNQMIEESAIKITQGQLNINPMKYGERSACDYCQYRGICQFDPDFLGNTSRLLPKMKSDAAMEAMKCKLEKGGAEDEL